MSMSAPLLAGPDGPFRVFYWPSAQAGAPLVLFAQPFAEEMNRSRAFFAHTAAQLNAQGWAALLVDPPGMGDSPGDFAQFRWSHGCNALLTAAAWAREQGHERLYGLGVRLGALLLADAVGQGLTLTHALAIAPVTSGEVHLRHWLRVRAHASLEAAPAHRVSLAQLTAALDRGETVFSAGYPLTPALAADLRAKSADTLPPPLPQMTLPAPHPWDQAEPESPVALAALLTQTLLALPPVPMQTQSAPPPILLAEKSDETPVLLQVDSATLLGWFHGARQPCQGQALLLAGGMQTRVGAHRSLVQMARRLSTSGIASLRLERRGVGDSPHPDPGFLAIDPEIAAGLAALAAQKDNSSTLQLAFGLCDAATALALSPHSARFSHLILANPWGATEADDASGAIRHHYRHRLTDPHAWGRLLRGQVNPLRLVRALGRLVNPAARHTPTDEPLIDQMLTALAQRRAPVLIILSGRDKTAALFSRALHRRWPVLPPHITLAPLADADHTFSTPGALDAVLTLLLAFVHDTALTPS